MTSIQTVRGKIRALEALARSTSSPHEADAALRRVAALIERYRLGSLDDGPVPAREIRMPAKSRPWHLLLVIAVAEHHGVAVARGTVGDRPAILLAGTGMDVDLVRQLATTLWRLIPKLARGAQPGHPEAFAEGFVSGLVAQFASGRAQARSEQPSASAAMVRVDGRLARAKVSLGAERTEAVGPADPVDVGAYAAGFLQGRSHAVCQRIADPSHGVHNDLDGIDRQR